MQPKRSEARRELAGSFEVTRPRWLSHLDMTGPGDGRSGGADFARCPPATQTIYGGLAPVIVTPDYLYLSAIVFLTGLQIDALARRGAQRGASRTARGAGRPY